MLQQSEIANGELWHKTNEKGLLKLEILIVSNTEVYYKRLTSQMMIKTVSIKQTNTR